MLYATFKTQVALNQAIAQNKLLLSDPEASQDAVDAAVTEIQNAIDALEPASSASVDGAGTTASSGISSSVTNTAAQAQTGLFVGVLAVAACGVLPDGDQKTPQQSVTHSA